MASSLRNVRGWRGTRARMRRSEVTLVWLLLLGAAGGCMQRRAPAEIPDPVTDRRIHAELSSRIAAEPALDGARLRVEVEAARVRIFGSVDGIGAWNCALRNAWLVLGVEGVSDYLIIERGPPEVTCLAVRDAVHAVGARPAGR